MEKQMSKDVEMLLGKPLPVVVKILWACVISAIAFILTFLRYQPRTYVKYNFPGYASVIAWFIPLSVYIILAVKNQMASHTFTGSIQMALCPGGLSCPSGPLNRKEYRDNLVKTQDSLKGHFAIVFRK